MFERDSKSVGPFWPTRLIQMLQIARGIVKKNVKMAKVLTFSNHASWKLFYHIHSFVRSFVRLLVITSGGTSNSGERSRSQMRAGFVFDTLTGGYVSGVETGNVTQKSACSHAMSIMEEASWSGQVWRRTGAPTSLLFQEYWPDNATSTRSYVLMWCDSYARWATMASSTMTTKGRIGQELSTDFCKLTMWGV